MKALFVLLAALLFVPTWAHSEWRYDWQARAEARREAAEARREASTARREALRDRTEARREAERDRAQMRREMARERAEARRERRVPPVPALVLNLQTPRLVPGESISILGKLAEAALTPDRALYYPAH